MCRFLAILLVVLPLPAIALTLVRPLDPSGQVPGTVSIYFEYYAHSAPGPSAGTVVVTEGGPGYPATESRAAYLALLKPLRATHDVVIMDNRGTGRSGAVDCPELQNAPALTEANIGACGRSLGLTAPLYSTTLAADDLAAVLDSLSLGKISLYGDSYGTYFAQVFALRHPERVRALILDGAYPLDGPDYPWYPHYAPATRAKFNLACERDAACKAIPGTSLDHIAPALARLRAQGEARALAIVMFGGAPAYATVREVDAAARAFADGDELPLRRLMAESFADVDSRDPTHSSRLFSAGLAAAVSCQDPPQIVDMNLPPEKRLVAREAAIARRPADAYAPFTIDEYRGMPLDYAFIDQCMQWPAVRALPLVAVRWNKPDFPVLVISGELDNMTSVADGTAAAEQFGNARHVVIANSFHVNALPHARSECGSVLVRRFIEKLDVGDDGCARAVAPVRLVARFARRAAELEPARGSGGTDALRVVSAALMTAKDVIVRVGANGVGKGVGLRGGSFDALVTANGYRATLRNVRWTEDVSVSGMVEWLDRGPAKGDVTIAAPAGVRGHLNLQWTEGMVATGRGKLGTESIVAEAPAP